MTKAMEAAIHAVRQYVYYTYNYYDLRKMCEEIWGGGCQGEHFYEKLMGYDCDFNRFFVNLSPGNQKQFAEWVIKNYKGMGVNDMVNDSEDSQCG